MASSSVQWPIGWIVSTTHEFNCASLLFDPNCVPYKGLGNNDDLDWLTGEIEGKKVYLARAGKEYRALACAAMKERFDIKFLIVGGTYLSGVPAFPPIGHCLLQIPEADENRVDHLLSSIPGESMASLAKLANAMDRFIAHSKTGGYNLDERIAQLARENPFINEGLVQPELRKFEIPSPPWNFYFQRTMLI